MKTRTIILIALAVAATSFTACEKCDNTKTLKITAKALRSANKTVMSGTQVNWQEGDWININGNDREVTNNNGTFSVIAGSAADNGNYYAAFPSSCVYDYNNGDPKFSCTLPSNASYGVDIMIPMFACTNGGSSLEFKTPYALIALNIPANDGSWGNSITISAPRVGSDADIHFVNGNPTFYSLTNRDTYGCTLSSAIPERGCTVYIPIVPCSGGVGEFNILIGDGHGAESTGSFNFIGGHIYYIDFVNQM